MYWFVALFKKIICMRDELFELREFLISRHKELVSLVESSVDKSEGLFGVFVGKRDAFSEVLGFLEGMDSIEGE